MSISFRHSHRGFATGTTSEARTVSATFTRAVLRVAPQNAEHDAACAAFGACTINSRSYACRTQPLLLSVSLTYFSLYTCHHADGTIPLSLILAETLVQKTNVLHYCVSAPHCANNRTSVCANNRTSVCADSRFTLAPNSARCLDKCTSLALMQSFSSRVKGDCRRLFKRSA